MSKRKPSVLPSDKIIDLQEQRTELIENLADVEKQLAKYSFAPESLVGKYYRTTDNDEEIFKLTDYRDGFFSVVTLELPADMKFDKSGARAYLRFDMQSFSDIFYNDIEEIPGSEFQQAYGQFMSIMPRS